MRLALLAGAVTLALGACGQDREGEPATQGSSATTPRPSSTPKAIATVPARSVRHAILDAKGVALGKNPGTARHYSFGSRRAKVEAAAGEWLGPPERSANAECGAGPMEFTRYGGLTLNFQGDKLVGWFLREQPHAVSSDGVKPGELLRDLKVTRSVRMIEGSTLDGEFDYLAADGNTIGGFAAGEGRDAVIESLYAGTNCFFR